MDLISWQEIKQELIESENNLLLGNGFSISYNAEDFNQKSIINEIDFLNKSVDVIDIEDCVAKTQGLVQEGNSYTVPQYIVKKWIKTLIHKAFIEKLFNKMPPTVRAKKDYNEKTLLPYKEFLSLFDNYYTLNYDPLLYWMSLHFINNGDSQVKAVMDAEEKYNKAKEGSKNKESFKNSFNNKLTDCMSKIREKIFTSKANKDKYQMKVYYADKCLYDENLLKAETDKAITIKNISNAICANLEKLSEESIEIKKEFERIEFDAIADFDSKKLEINEINNGIKIIFDDGFRTNKETKLLEWAVPEAQNVYFLHGAFHILKKDNSVTKIKADDTSTMLKNIQNEWDKGYESLTILESTAKDKIAEINKNPYLSYCFKSFENIRGSLVTFGVSFFDSDNHIVNAINSNQQLTKIYIGCYDEPSIELVKKFVNKDVKFFSTKGMFDLSGE